MRWLRFWEAPALVESIPRIPIWRDWEHPFQSQSLRAHSNLIDIQSHESIYLALATKPYWNSVLQSWSPRFISGLAGSVLLHSIQKLTRLLRSRRYWANWSYRNGKIVCIASYLIKTNGLNWDHIDSNWIEYNLPKKSLSKTKQLN